MRYLLFYCLISIAAGCCSRCKEEQSSTRYHDDGRAKPVVALATMVDTASFDVPWSVADEFTSSIYQLIAKKGQIFIHAQEDFALAANPFADELGWMKKEFPNHEFAVFLELAEHEMTPSKVSSELGVSNSLNMGIKIRVIDLRGAEPKIVLQQMIRDSYYIPRTLFPVDYEMITWGTDEYNKSPLGIAHHRIAQEIADRVSEYILLAKSR
ncbi:MAG TPA: CT253 family lipoprotein [Chlamydiales bacterium]|nr:CT253 family lipoprotein [Chlamydiales bacterium]